MHKDVTEPFFVDEPVDFVYHFASPASPIDYLRLPLHTLKVGSYGTHHALGLAKLHRARFLTASTSEVYGDPQVHPQPESYWGHVNPIGPRGVYDEAKRYAEALTMAYHRQQGVDTAIVRIFNTYGPRMRPHDGRAIPTFLRQALQDRPITVFGTGSQTRSFTYVDDLIDGIIRLAESGVPPAGEHRQPERVHAARAGQGRDRGHRLALGDRLRGAADRRPAGPPAGHLARARAARLGADGGAASKGLRARSTPPVSPRSPAHFRRAVRMPRDLPRGSRVEAVEPVADTQTKIPEPPRRRRQTAREASFSLRSMCAASARRRSPSCCGWRRCAGRRGWSRCSSLDFACLLSALIVALMVKAVVRDGEWAWEASLTEARRTIAFAYLVTVLLFARSEPVRRARAAARHRADRLRAVPGHARLADLRPGQRPGLLELLRLLRHARSSP